MAFINGKEVLFSPIINMTGGGSADLSNYYTKGEVDEMVGEISTALDEIIALQEFYTGATFDELHEYAEEVKQGGAE